GGGNRGPAEAPARTVAESTSGGLGELLSHGGDVIIRGSPQAATASRSRTVLLRTLWSLPARRRNSFRKYLGRPSPPGTRADSPGQNRRPGRRGWQSWRSS